MRNNCYGNPCSGSGSGSGSYDSFESPSATGRPPHDSSRSYEVLNSIGIFGGDELRDTSI